ncbi:hypothetical protein P9112_001923 [Eukaryota sp. TZLM1-RC]
MQALWPHETLSLIGDPSTTPEQVLDLCKQVLSSSLTSNTTYSVLKALLQPQNSSTLMHLPQYWDTLHSFVVLITDISFFDLILPVIRSFLDSTSLSSTSMSSFSTFAQHWMAYLTPVSLLNCFITLSELSPSSLLASFLTNLLDALESSLEKFSASTTSKKIFELALPIIISLGNVYFKNQFIQKIVDGYLATIGQLLFNSSDLKDWLAILPSLDVQNLNISELSSQKDHDKRWTRQLEQELSSCHSSTWLVIKLAFTSSLFNKISNTDGDLMLKFALLAAKCVAVDDVGVYQSIFDCCRSFWGSFLTPDRLTFLDRLFNHIIACQSINNQSNADSFASFLVSVVDVFPSQVLNFLEQLDFELINNFNNYLPEFILAFSKVRKMVDFAPLMIKKFLIGDVSHLDLTPISNAFVSVIKSHHQSINQELMSLLIETSFEEFPSKWVFISLLITCFKFNNHQLVEYLINSLQKSEKKAIFEIKSIVFCLVKVLSVSDNYAISNRLLSLSIFQSKKSIKKPIKKSLF